MIYATTASGHRLILQPALGDHVDPCAACPPDQPDRMAEVLLEIRDDPNTPIGSPIPVCGDCVAAALAIRMTAALHPDGREWVYRNLAGAEKPCGRLLVGRGTDTADPLCQLPAGHPGPCE